MIDTDVVSKYETMGKELLLVLRSLRDNEKKSVCINIPLIQREEVDVRNDGYIKISDYNNEDINDTVSYRIPERCHVEQKHYRRVKKHEINDEINLGVNQMTPETI